MTTNSLPARNATGNRFRPLVLTLTAALALAWAPGAFAQETPEIPPEIRVLSESGAKVLSGEEAASLARALGRDEPSFVFVLGDKIPAAEDLANARISARGAGATLEEALRNTMESGHSVGLFGGAYLGVELVNLNEPLRAHFGVPEDSGVLVSNVAENSPAARAGIQVGDILTRFEGEDVPSSRRLTSMVRRAEAGDPADLEIWRDGKVEILSTTLDERPRQDLKPGSFSFFLRGREDLDGDGEVDVFVGPEDVHEKIQEYFNGDEWKERHEHVQRFLQERRPDMKALEERLESLKERLADLERMLEERGLADNN